MKPLTHTRLAANAYRTLGLSASAGQSAVDDAARRMRIWSDPRLIPPTPWDLPWLGPLARGRTEIEQAVARLSDPASRVEERVLWYLGAAPPGAGPGGPGPEAEGPRTDGPLPAHHDAAVAMLHRACASDPDAADVGTWRPVVEAFGALAGSESFAAWLSRVEGEGDFEKRASSAEVAAAARSAPPALAAALASRARAAPDRDDADACAAVVSLLRSTAARDGTAAVVRDLLDCLEDVLDARCGALDDELRDKLRTIASAPAGFYAANYAATVAAARTFNASIQPVLGRLHETLGGRAGETDEAGEAGDPKAVGPASGEDADRLLRMRSRCAGVLALVGLGWEWSGRFVTAEETLQAALVLAEGSRAEASIRKDLERVAPLAEGERLGRRYWGPGVAEFRYAYPSTGIATLGAGAAAGKAEYAPTTAPCAARPPARAAPGGARKRIGFAVAIFAAFTLLRILAANWDSNSRTDVDIERRSRNAVADFERQFRRMQPPTTGPAGWEPFSTSLPESVTEHWLMSPPDGSGDEVKVPTTLPHDPPAPGRFPDDFGETSREP